MYDFFDYEGRQKGYKKTVLNNRKNAKKIVSENAGKKVWFLIKRDIDHSGRGMFFPRSAILSGKMINSTIFFSSGSYCETVDWRDIQDFAIEI